MAYSSLAEFVQLLKKQDEIIEVEGFVDPVLEISEITDRFSKSEDGGKALLFKNNGTDFPVLTNAMGSLKRLSLAHGVKEIDDIALKIEDLFKNIREPRKSFFEKLALLPRLARVSGYFPSRYRGKAPVQEVILEDPDLGILPILKTWPYDGGRFITLPMVITIDPESGERNVGMYRMQVMDSKTTGMHWHRHKTGANHYEKYQERGRRMPIAVALGGDPVLSYAATAPLPENIDEFLFAGFLREKSVSLVPAVSQDILVPAEADIIIEGYVDPAEEKINEGPFGDHTGFYSLEDYYPAFHVTAVTHRNSAIYPATLVGIPPQEDAKIARATERIFIMPIRQAIVPELTEMIIPDYGVAHNLSLVNIKKNYPGQARKVMNALWGAGQMMFNKVLVIADEGADLESPEFLFEALGDLEPSRDIVFSSGPLDVLDHAADFMGYGGKMGVDLTKKLPEENQKRKAKDRFVDPDMSSDITGHIKKVKSFTNKKGDRIFSICSIEKGSGYHKEHVTGYFLSNPGYSDLKMLVLTDTGVDLNDPREFLWYVLNNIEVNRDISIETNAKGGAVVVADGSSKISESDEFRRDWPNVVTMSEEIIQKIDEKWHHLKLGEFIPSPSLKYRRLIVTPGASVRK